MFVVAFYNKKSGFTNTENGLWQNYKVECKGEKTKRKKKQLVKGIKRQRGDEGNQIASYYIL